jgi:outer membrane biosynthesis protein TonB
LLLAGAIGIGVWWLTRATPEALPVEQAPPAAVELVPKLEEVEPPPVASPSGPETKPSAAARPEAAAAPAPAPAPERPAPREESTTEVALLDEARQALGGNPAKALQLTRLHEQRFPGGVLGQEREVIAIDALSRLGRTAEAKRRAERFNARYPGSAHQSKIDRLITRITQ